MGVRAVGLSFIGSGIVIGDGIARNQRCCSSQRKRLYLKCSLDNSWSVPDSASAALQQWSTTFEVRTGTDYEPLTVLLVSQNGYRAVYAQKAFERAAETHKASRTVLCSCAALVLVTTVKDSKEKFPRSALRSLPLPLTEGAESRGFRLRRFGENVQLFDAVGDPLAYDLILCLDRSVRERVLSELEAKGSEQYQRSVRLLSDVSSEHLSLYIANPRMAHYERADIPRLFVNGFSTDQVFDQIDEACMRAVRHLVR
uniref:Uncharacterized protein n=1 Tax=Timspurckia oligopyrenoides TaxID=708627 RepID=A0A7S1ER12_9RHOD|mmetsp:Transcript_13425/g.24080  ORF Transcript_13425/g.24080 Transcript_13425/m.24080 type:complete len:256 (+) Transcript_13425:37-804(+)